MKPISINLASQPFYNTRLYLAAFAGSVALLLIMTVLNIVTLYQSQAAWKHFGDDQAGLQSELRSLDHEMLTLDRELKRRDLAEVGEQSKFANIAIVQRMFSWTLMFNRLEQVMPPTVKLRSLRPTVDAEGIEFRVVGTAKNASAFADFEEALLEEPLFSAVYPLSEAVSSTGKGIDFNLSFRYLASKDSQVGVAKPATERALEEPAAQPQAAAGSGLVEGDSVEQIEDASPEVPS
jgi:Tfp pilus assembly protein PilN